jgi:flagellar biosynthetic protein FliP
MKPDAARARERYPRLADNHDRSVLAAENVRRDAVARLHPKHSVRTFVRHFIEMVVAMIVGMMVFGGAVSLVGLGDPDYAPLEALLMATYMSAGIAPWMLYRGHTVARVLEMIFAMFAAFVVLLIPFWAGFASDSFVLTGGHVLMLPFMLGVMLYRRDGIPEVMAVIHAKKRVAASNWTSEVNRTGYLRYTGPRRVSS